MTLDIDIAKYGLLQSVVDKDNYQRSIGRFREAGILLPTFGQLSDPSTIPEKILSKLEDIDPNEAHPLNLFRVHWYNAFESVQQTTLPEHIVLPRELTGVDAQIVLLFGNRFPMIGAHKVLAAYSCFLPRVVSGQFDPSRHRAVWPSTGNYARGGIAISTLMQSRGVAVLPENMSQERFDWLDKWVLDPQDVVRTPGSESNVKEIYDACNELEKNDVNFILNQFSEFANHIGHYVVTGKALGHVFEKMKESNPSLELRAFVSASGSAGTLGAGDRLKDDFGAKIVAVEALECPTMLYNGYGEHNIQGIGDKHIPLIHNVMNTDIATAVSDQATDGLNLVFTTEAGKSFLVEEMGVDGQIVQNLRHFGFSSICNMLAGIKTAKALQLGENDVVITVATDGSELYESEKQHLLTRRFGDRFQMGHAEEIVSSYLKDTNTDHLQLLDDVGKEKIFNLGYYTWVEQQGVSIEDFDARRDQEFWDQLHTMTPEWDKMVEEFNDQTGVTV